MVVYWEFRNTNTNWNQYDHTQVVSQKCEGATASPGWEGHKYQEIRVIIRISLHHRQFKQACYCWPTNRIKHYYITTEHVL